MTCRWLAYWRCYCKCHVSDILICHQLWSTIHTSPDLMNLKLQFCNLDVSWFAIFWVLEDLKVLEESEKMSKASCCSRLLSFSPFEFQTTRTHKTVTNFEFLHRRQNVQQRSRRCRRRFRCRTSQLWKKFSWKQSKFSKYPIWDERKLMPQSWNFKRWDMMRCLDTCRTCILCRSSRMPKQKQQN